MKVRCPSCSQVAEAGTSMCPNCGGKLPQLVKAAAPVVPVTAPVLSTVGEATGPTGSLTDLCPVCGSKLAKPIMVRRVEGMRPISPPSETE